MGAQLSADYLRRLTDAVDQFAAAFDAWMETQVESDHMEGRGLWPTVWPRDDADAAEVRSRELAVAEAAGAAGKAVPVTGAYIMVQGIGALDPVANWMLMSQPKALLAPSDIRNTTATIKGRLKALLIEAESNADNGLPAFGPFALHAIIWTAASPYWTNHRRRVAVREAAEALTVHWTARLGRGDVDGTKFWQQTLKPEEPEIGIPRLAWPGDPNDRTVRSMRGGLAGLAAGLNLTVRNVSTHSNHEMSEQEALEQLGAYSYLARLLDQCEIRRIDGCSTVTEATA